jgi:hypothetical protein
MNVKDAESAEKKSRRTFQVRNVWNEGKRLTIANSRIMMFYQVESMRFSSKANDVEDIFSGF